MSESTTSSKTSINAEDEFSTPEVIISDGVAKFRDGKRWKNRYCILTKLSPAADCLQLQVYRDEKERARNGHTKASLSLQNFLAMETGFTLDKESHTLAIICQDLCVVLAFDNRERLIQWSVRIANNLGEGQHYLVQLASAPVKSKLTPGPVKLHVTDRKFCLTGGIPPRLLGSWEVPHLRRYGVVEGRLVFEGGSRCGKGEGVHVLVPDPPQLSLIMEALDMSSKGQLVRGSTRESRRFGSVVDSPRKSMTSRLSEMRTLVPADSSANISVYKTNVTISSTISPIPRESRSAEALCSAFGEGNEQPGSLWMSSESSSRCDLDNCDNISVAICPDDGTGHVSQKAPLSPARTLQGQPLQISKPLPSAMERGLSCMSKLGQQGQDILTPSWTMDLNVSSTSSGATGLTASASSATTIIAPPQGSIGSGNSDRLSISSHGSSGGATEYYYDTPRSVLVAEMRRAARANTPPGMFQNTQMQPAGSSNCHFSGGQTGTNGGCPSPYRVPRGSGHHSNGNGIGGCSIQNHNGMGPGLSSQNAGCGGSCHCSQAQGRAVGGHGNGHIYYNGVAEQKSHGTKPPINLHSGPGPGPYENYDFPRCIPPQASLNQIGCYPFRGEGSVSGPSSMSGIDWTKKPPMDRSSVATTASTSISMGSDQLSEFYDTPRQVCPCCAPAVPGCPCCSQNPVSGHLQQLQPHPHHQTQVTHHPVPSSQPPHSHYHNPSCIMPRDPMENYDVPPHNNPHNISHANDTHNNPVLHPMQHSNTSISINGEGKMPLVAGNLPARPNPNAIYAQVDKSKKTPRPLPAQQHQQHFVTCDSHPIYENRNAQVQHQPTYINLEASSNISKASTVSKGKPPAPEPQPQPSQSQLQVSHTDHHPSLAPGVYGHSNYVNLEFANSLQLYENAKELSTESVMIPKETQVLVHHHQSSADVVEADSTTLVPNEPESAVIISSPKIATIVETEDEISSSSPAQVPSVEPIAEESSQSEEAKDTKDDEKSSASASVSISVDGSSKEESSGMDRRGSNESDEAVSLPLRRSSSVPCKGGHANRGSASSSDSGVSGDGGLFFDDSSPSNDIGSLCHHESLPRKTQRTSPGASTGKSTSATSSPRPQESVDEVENVELDSQSPTSLDPLLATRHYETIAEVESKVGGGNNSVDSPLNINGNSGSVGSNSSVILSNPVNPSVAAVRSAEPVQTRRNLVSEANSTSSGNSDMSDYIGTLSSCSRGSSETVTSVLANAAGSVTNVNLNISASPKKSTSMKPRSGKEYFKIDRSMFKSD